MRQKKKAIILAAASLCCLVAGTAAMAASGSGNGIGGIASNIKGNLASIAYLITAGSYVAGMAFGVGAIIKFKAHKDNPTQVPVGTPIALLFVAAALLFIPSVFKASGGTLFGGSGQAGGISGVTSFT